MGRGSIYLACLAVLLSGSVILVPHAAEADPYHLQVENTLSANSNQIQDNDWWAQSFVPIVIFQISRVSLYVEDTGSGGLRNVSIRPDTAGTPSGTVLAGGASGVPSLDGWVDFDVAPYAELSPGQSYWIVAHVQTGGGQRFDWWDSDSNSAYLPGTGARSTNGGTSWSSHGVDFTFRVYGFERPNFTFDATASLSTVMWGDAVVFRMDFTNTGPAASSDLWINVTLPSAMTYLSDDASSIGGVRTGAHNYTFVGVTPGVYTFTLTALADGVVANGTLTVTDILFEAADHVGSPMTQELRSVPVTIVTNLGFTFGVTPSVFTLTPGDSVRFRMDFTNLGPAPSAGVWVNITLPSALTYAADDAASIGGKRTGAHNYSFTLMAAGSYSFNFTAVADGVVANGTVVVVDFRFEAADHGGVPFSQEDRALPVMIVTDLAFTFGITPTMTSVPPGETVILRVDFANLGPATSLGLWVNVSIPSGLVYVADDSGSIGGVRTGAHNYTFSTLAPASYSYNLTLSADAAIGNETQLIVEFQFTARDSFGAALTPEQRNATITVQPDLLRISLALNATLFSPGHVVVVTATVTNLGLQSALNLLVRGSVDVNLTYETSSPSGSYNPSTRTVQWNLISLGAQAQITLEWTGRVKIDTPDLASLRFSMPLAYEDANGTARPPLNVSEQASVQAPVITPILGLDSGSAGRGDRVTATFLYANTGTGTASEAWANWTLGDAFALVSLFPALSPTLTSQGFSVSFTNVTPGVHALLAELEVTRGMQDGLAMSLELRWAALGKNGNPLPPATFVETVRLDAPVIGLTLGAREDSVGPGSAFALNLTVRNTGRAPAVGMLELALPSGVAYLGDNGTIAPTSSADRVRWEITGLDAESLLVMQIQLHAFGEPGPRGFRFLFNYSEGRGSTPVVASSNAVTVQLSAVGGINPGLPWWLWLPLLGAAVPPAFFVVRRWRRRPLRLHDVFVVDKGGRVLAHQSDTLISERDEDIVAAAFTAVQEFVKHHFGRSPEENVRTLEFGDRKILLEQGDHHYIAVVISGEETRHLKDKLRRLSEEINDQYRSILKDWRGDIVAIEGISQLLPDLWMRRPEGGGLSPILTLLRGGRSRMRTLLRWKRKD